MPSSPQTVPTYTVFDYEYDATGAAYANAPVSVRLDYSEAFSISPVVNIESSDISTTTDGNGYWSVKLVANDNITPASTVYTVRIPNGRSYQISVSGSGVPANGWQSSAIIVSAPAALQPVGQTVANLTVTGNETVGGTLGVTGATTLSTLTTSGAATLASASVTANETVGGTLGVTGATTLSTVSTSGLATLASASVTGNETVGGTLGVTGVTTLGTANITTANITTAAVSGNETVTGTLGVTGATTLSSTLAVTGETTAPDYKATGVASLANAATGRWVGHWSTVGAPTGLTAANGDWGYDANFTLWAFNGSIWRAMSYGVINSLNGTGASNTISFTSIPAGFSKLIIDIYGRTTAAVTSIAVGAQFNADTGANYDWEAANFATTTALSNGNGLTSIQAGFVPGANAPTNQFSQIRLEVFDYNQSTGDKVMTVQGGVANAYSSTNIVTLAGVGFWHNAVVAPVTRIDVFVASGNWSSTSVARLSGAP